MDMTPTTTPKSPELESETPNRIQSAKPISFTNGVLKRHHNPHHHHHAVVVTYKECLKNHAAALGGHALDGCGEFMPSPSSNPSDPTSLKCAACGCHRNFHRRDPEDTAGSTLPLPHPSSTAIEYQPHHRHRPPPPPLPPGQSRSPNSSSPPPISSSYMLLALSGSNNKNYHNNHNLPFSDLNFSNNNLPNQTPGSRKRFRTKFSQYQKEKMHEFAERVGWKMQKRDDEAVREFCREIGVDRGVLKVWMHNNKNTFGRRDPFSSADGGRMTDNGGESNHNTGVCEANQGGNSNNTENNGVEDAGKGGGGGSLTHDLHHHDGGGFESDSRANCGNTNGSSSSS